MEAVCVLGHSQCGVSQGSPLSSLIWMAPILAQMQKRVKEEVGSEVDVEIPSIADNMCTDIVDWEGGCNMPRVEANIKTIIKEVADECNLPLETYKEEILNLRKNKKERNGD